MIPFKDPQKEGYCSTLVNVNTRQRHAHTYLYALLQATHSSCSLLTLHTPTFGPLDRPRLGGLRQVPQREPPSKHSQCVGTWVGTKMEKVYMGESPSVD